MTNGVCAVRCESYDRVGGTDGWERIGRGKTARGASGVDVIKPSTVHKTSDDHDGDPSVNRYLSRPGPARQLTFRNRTEVNASHQIRFTQGYMRITRGHGASQRLYSTASSSTSILTTIPTCLISHLQVLPLPFNTSKESTKVQ